MSFKHQFLHWLEFKRFFDNDLKGDYLTTTKGTIMNCNKAFAQKLGYDKPKELIGKNITEFYQNADDREVVFQMLSNKKILEGYVSNLKRKDGENITCKENIVGKYDKRQKLTHYYGYLQDVTEKSRPESELIKKNQFLSSVLENQEELIARYYPDTTIIFANKAYCSFFDKSEEELIGTKLLQSMSKTERSIEQSKLSKLDSQNPKLISERQFVAADGTIKTLMWTDTAIFDEMGMISEIQGTGIDLAKIYAAKDETLFLWKLNELTRKIAVDYLSVPETKVKAFITKSLGEIGKFIKADRAHIINYNWQLQTCSNKFEWCDNEIEPQIEYLQDISLNGLSYIWNPHKQGLPYIVEDVFALDESDLARQILEPQGIKSLITVPIMDNGYCLGFVGLDYVRNNYTPSKREKDVLLMFADVLVNIKKRSESNIELLHTKEKAEQSDKLKTAFINNISHEIRTPLNVILGFGQIMSNSKLSKVERKEYFENLEKSSTRLMTTVTDYMDMASLVSNTMNVNKKEFALEAVFVDLVEKMKDLCSEKKLEFNLEIPNEAKDITVNSDPELIKKIIEKMIDNAIKFTNIGGITLGCFVNPEHIDFYVKDTGIGIENEKLNLIFEIFKQADVSMTRGYEGSGLGLTIARGLATLLDSELNVTSQKDFGSTFTFSLPLDVDKKGDSEDLSIATSKKHKEKPLILIAEDDELNFAYLKIILKGLDHTYIRAVNGQEAVDFCRQNKDISVVLMDIKMPVMTGDEATRQIREFRPELPIIATTAYALTGDENRFLQAGFSDYLPKPINREKLLAIIRKYVG